MARRNALLINIDILRRCLEECKPTPLMYSTNLCWKALQKHLKMLINSGLLKVIHITKDSRYNIDRRTEKVYLATESAIELIKAFDKINLMILNVDDN